MVSRLFNELKNDKRKQIILFSVTGFLINAVILYPYACHWDSACLFTAAYKTGHAWVGDWLGWYFPLLWTWLYKITGMKLIMGTYIHLIYWIAITLLYFSLFDVKKTSLWYYFFFCWSPDAFLFLGCIANNSLYFVTLLLGIAICIFQLKRNSSILLGVFFLAQCVFIRREVLVYALPLIILFGFIRLRAKRGVIVSFICSVLLSVLLFGALFPLERICTRNIENYHQINTLGYTALFDLTCMGYYKQERLLPDKYFKPEYDSAKTMAYMKNMKELQKALKFDITLRPFWKETMGLENSPMIPLTPREFIPIYLSNVKPYVLHRCNMVSGFLGTPDGILGNAYNDPQFRTWCPSPSPILKIMSGLRWYVSVIFPLNIYFFAALAFLVLGISKKIPFATTAEKIVFFSVMIISLFTSAVTMLGAVATQGRYILPQCLIMYYAIVYAVYLMRNTRKAHYSDNSVPA